MPTRKDWWSSSDTLWTEFECVRATHSSDPRPSREGWRSSCTPSLISQDELAAGYALHNFYVWHITNPSEIQVKGFKVRTAVGGNAQDTAP